MEYLKLLNSFLDSMGSGAPPFASNSVLKSALGKSAQMEALPAAGTTADTRPLHPHHLPSSRHGRNAVWGGVGFLWGCLMNAGNDVWG